MREIRCQQISQLVIFTWMRDFRKLEIWKRSILLAQAVNQVTRRFPGHERYALAVQMNKAAVSIPSNIAEGCGRHTKPELIRFIHISIGVCI